MLFLLAALSVSFKLDIATNKIDWMVIMRMKFCLKAPICMRALTIIVPRSTFKKIFKTLIIRRN